MFPLNIKPYPQTVLNNDKPYQQPVLNFAPSRAEQWLSCPLSAVLTQELNKSSVVGGAFIETDSLNEQYADFIQQGVLAHKYAEQLFNNVYFGTPIEPMNLPDEIIQAANKYNLMIQHVVYESREKIIYLGAEKDVDIELSEKAKKAGVICSGKYDATAITTSAIHVFDLKYGVNDEVGAMNNAQLMLYAVGLYQQYKHMFTDTINIVLHVCSPRQEQVYSTYELSSEQLMYWLNNTVIPCVDEIAKLDINRVMSNPSVEICKGTHCSGYLSGRCNRCKQWAFNQMGASSSNVLPNEKELVEEVHLRDFINGFIENSKNSTINELENGRVIDGLYCEKKMVRGMPKDKTGKQAVIARLESIPELANIECYDKSPKPIGYFEQVLGKEETAKLLGDVVELNIRKKLKLTK